MKTRHQQLLEHADPILTALRFEAEQERRAQDDDLPNTPDPLSSAQSRRAAVLGVH
jgi:hypothetical protein